MATLPDTWRDGVRAKSCWSGVCILWLGGKGCWTCNFFHSEKDLPVCFLENLSQSLRSPEEWAWMVCSYGHPLFQLARRQPCRFAEHSTLSAYLLLIHISYGQDCSSFYTLHYVFFISCFMHTTLGKHCSIFHALCCLFFIYPFVYFVLRTVTFVPYVICSVFIDVNSILSSMLTGQLISFIRQVT